MKPRIFLARIIIPIGPQEYQVSENGNCVSNYQTMRVCTYMLIAISICLHRMVTLPETRKRPGAIIIIITKSLIVLRTYRRTPWPPPRCPARFSRWSFTASFGLYQHSHRVVLCITGIIIWREVRLDFTVSNFDENRKRWLFHFESNLSILYTDKLFVLSSFLTSKSTHWKSSFFQSVLKTLSWNL